MDSNVTTATIESAENGVTVILVHGIIVTNIGVTDVAPVVEKAVAEGDPPKIIIHLGNVRYLDSYSYGWLLKQFKNVNDKNGSIALCEPNEDILALFDVTNFGMSMPVYAGLENARDAMRTGDESKRIGL